MNGLFNLNTLPVVFGAIVAAVMGLLLVAAVPAFGADEQEGTIQSASETELVLHLGTESVTFQVNGQTNVTLNGIPAEIGDLMAGDATVSFTESDDGERTATSIEAIREDSPPDES